MHAPRALLTLGAAALLGAAGGAAVVAVAGTGSHTTTTTIEASPAPRVPVAAGRGGALDATQVYARAKGSVAFISAQTAQGGASGSGFVVSKDGLVVTNAHVVNGASAVTVKLGDGATHQAMVVGRDESTDLALLRVQGAGGTRFAPLPFADSGRLQVGDATYAIGSPFGLQESLTSGVVSALDRQIDAPNGFTIAHVIQTDAPINPGNSGGPLLDDHGRVIGVNSQILNGGSSSQGGNVGIGFAIPSDTVSAIVAQLAATGHVAHAWLGVQLAPAESGSGAQVAGLASGSPAAAAGLRAGDTIVALDGTRVDGAGALAAAVAAHKPGDRVRLTVAQGGAQRTLTVTLGTQPQQPTAN
ncbi:MAG: trypsin-like peptidase domain-containing protein [Actinobacteria bacterium]|nr:trypsin-like peptidase domain-containing protein [Actinomycetota bacterium]